MIDMTGLAGHRPTVDAALASLEAGRVVERIFARDHTVWRPDPDEISDRLGWLDVAGRMRSEVASLRALAADAVRRGDAEAVLLGMGGSSLAPEVFARTFGTAPGYLPLTVLDTTDPAAVLGHARRIDVARTLFVVSTKSGGTVETLSLWRYFHDSAVAAVGAAAAGERFVAITDPGSGLAATAARHGFRATVLADPTIGGRFSALSPFGLAPAALIGADLDRLLDAAVGMTDRCRPGVPLGANPAALLGAALGALARAGRDKLVLTLSEPVASLADWIEQLIAESTGKDGVGILPVVGEAPRAPDAYAADRLFVDLALDGHAGDDAARRAQDALADAGHPVLRLTLPDRYAIAGQMFLWELATAIAGALLGVQPFDQPDVESAKSRARDVVADYRASGRIAEPDPAGVFDGITLFGAIPGRPAGDARSVPDSATLRAILTALVADVPDGGYLALQAYLPPAPEVTAALGRLRAALAARTRAAVTLGFGPRFLHSTGQLHKADAGRGRFVQLTADPVEDAVIPGGETEAGHAVTFGVLERAQALGDAAALAAAGRRVVRLHLGRDPRAALERLADLARFADV